MKKNIEILFYLPRPLPASPLLHCQNRPFVKNGLPVIYIYANIIHLP